jgi:hypothetical protein
MSEYIWSFVINPFLTATEDSYRLAIKMSADYLASLKADGTNPAIEPLIVIYEPLDTALQNSYNTWQAQGGSQTGDTLQVKLLIKTLSGQKAKTWDNAIQVVFPDDTTDYQRLMSRHRMPFQHGTQQQRISAVSALKTNLNGIVPLAAVETDVTNFLQSIQDALNAQKASIKSTGNFSGAVEAARIAACTQIFGDYGTLLSQNPANPTSISHYFPVKYIHDHTQVFFTKQLSVGQVYTIAKHTLAATDQLRITVNNAAGIQIYPAAKKDTPNTHTGMAFVGNSTTTISASQLGDIENLHELMAANNDANLQADFDLEFL